MDKANDPGDSCSGPWTNEKHMHFLNSVEASFVRTMLENNSHHIRLDRYLPDTSDSTLDLKTQRRKKKVTTGLDNRGDRRTRRQSYKPHNSTQDQVVPQIGNRRDDRDERDSSNTSVAPAN